VIGAGELGHALSNYPGFTDRGFRIVMLFDNDPSKIGKSIGEFVVEDSVNMVERICNANVKSPC